MNECCNFHDLCELWNAHFDTMISCVSLLAVLFGLVIPIFATLIQHNNLKNERERMDKDMDRRFSELEKLRERWDKDVERRFSELKNQREQLIKDTEEKFAELEKQRGLIAQHDLQINELQNLSSDVYITAAQFYVARCHDTITRCPRETKGNPKILCIESVLIIYS